MSKMNMAELAAKFLMPGSAVTKQVQEKQISGTEKTAVAVETYFTEKGSQAIWTDLLGKKKGETGE